MSRLSQLGSSRGLRLPKNVVECAGLRVGDLLTVRLLDNGDILIRRAGSPDQPNAAAVTEETRQAMRVPTDEEVLAQW